MVATASPWTTRKDLQFAARKLAVIQWRYNAPLITTVKNPTTGALVLPDDGYVVGLHRKQKGGALATAQTLNDIMAHGEGGPTLQIPTERRVSIGVEPYEMNRANLENWLGTDLSGVTPDAAGGVHLPVPSLPLNILSRVALIGRWDYNGLPAYIAWVGNRVNVSETGEQGITDADVIGFPYTFNFQGVDELDANPFFVEIFGEGWEAMNNNTDAGFGIAGITSLTVLPSEATIDLSMAENQQLTATDSNGNDRTNDATWGSGTPSVATVNSSGVVEAVSAGTSTITATVGAHSDTCAVTVIA